MSASLLEFALAGRRVQFPSSSFPINGLEIVGIFFKFSRGRKKKKKKREKNFEKIQASFMTIVLAG